MTLTPEQIAAIRSARIGSIGYGPPEDRRSVDRDLVRKIIALGLCVIESGVTAANPRTSSPYPSKALAKMLDALAAELERP